MPWTPEDAPRHTKKARSRKQQSLWSEIANRLLAKGASDASAIRQANAVVARQRKRR